MFADVRCQYFYGAPADQLGSGEQTQLYEFEEEGEERVREEEEEAGGGEGGGGGEGRGGGGEEVEGGGRGEEVEGGGGREEVGGGEGEEEGGGGGEEVTERPAAGSVEDSEVVRARRRGGGRLESDSSAEQSEPTGNKTVKEEGTIHYSKQDTHTRCRRTILSKMYAHSRMHTHAHTHSAPPGQ